MSCSKTKGSAAKRTGAINIAKIRNSFEGRCESCPVLPVDFVDPKTLEFLDNRHVVADTGAQVSVAGRRMLKRLGIKAKDLDDPGDSLQGVYCTPLDCIGMTEVGLRVAGRIAMERIFFCSDVPHNEVYISLTACRNLGLVHPDFPMHFHDPRKSPTIANIDGSGAVVDEVIGGCSQVKDRSDYSNTNIAMNGKAAPPIPDRVDRSSMGIVSASKERIKQAESPATDKGEKRIKQAESPATDKGEKVFMQAESPATAKGEKRSTTENRKEINKQAIERIEQNETDEEWSERVTKELLEEYKDVFCDDDGRLKPMTCPPVKIELKVCFTWSKEHAIGI